MNIGNERKKEDFVVMQKIVLEISVQVICAAGPMPSLRRQ